jgi:hypothetical protein
MPRQPRQLHRVHHQPQQQQLAMQQQQQLAMQQQLLQLQEMMLLQQQLQLYPRTEGLHQQLQQQLMRQLHQQQHLQVTVKRMTRGEIRQRLLLMKIRMANSHKILQFFSL